MRRVVVATVLLLLLPPAAVPGDGSDVGTPEAAAERVLAAVVAGDDAALKALAKTDDPDPWLVADALLARKERDAALAFARAAPREDTERLPGYLLSDAAEVGPGRRELLARVVGLDGAGDPEGVLGTLAGVEDGVADVVSVRLGICRGRALSGRGDFEAGGSAFREAGARAERIGWLRAADSALRGSAAAGRKAGDRERELFAREALLEVKQARGDRAGVASALASIAYVHQRRADFGRARRFYERALAAFRELEDRSGEARQANAIGWLHLLRGEYAKSLEWLERSLAISEELGDRRAMVGTLDRLGTVFGALGDSRGALGCFVRQRELLAELGDRAALPNVLQQIGRVRWELGDRKMARALIERSQELAEELGRPADVAMAIRFRVWIDRERLDLERVLALLRRTEELFRQAGDWFSVCMSLVQIAQAQREAGHLEDAWETLRRMRGVIEDEDVRWAKFHAMWLEGMLRREAGDFSGAVRLFDRALRTARGARNRGRLLSALHMLIDTHLEAGKPGRALDCARQALGELESVLGGLGGEEGASAREEYAGLFARGALAGMRLEDPAAVVEFLEYGRAGELLETLGGGRAARHADLPEELIAAEEVAKDAESRARREHARAVESGDGERVRETAAALEAALERRRQVVGRIQREAKRVAGVLYPRPEPLEGMRDRLGGGTALVIYGFCVDEALAVVVGAEEARLVTLGPVAEIEKACAQAAPAAGSPGSRGLSVGEAPAAPAAATAALGALAALVVEPLSLGDEVRTVLVSPAGALGYAPWGALFDRPVACVPSGTTWVHLGEEERRRGTKVLALGDPAYGVRPGDRSVEVYRRGGLPALPATRPEAKAVGDRVLLGEEATEAGLAAALKKERRWRAVHLACHGLVDTERPLLSSLAVTPGGGEDGFLTCLDLFGLDVPADLVVLSACETARGKVVKAEGIVGLTRAFMYAGSPRILCSLWKVDDEATMALMVKFYELWNPEEGEGLPAAAALRGAQGFIRSQKEWKHPYYWAAWVLWGLPD